jgi:hypothetical protein
MVYRLPLVRPVYVSSSSVSLSTKCSGERKSSRTNGFIAAIVGRSVAWLAL